MRKAYYGSLCYCGIRGGGIYVDDENVVFRAQTLTLPDEYKNLSIPIKEIRKMEQGSLLFLPTVKIYLKDRDYKFVVFNRQNFFDTIVEIRNAM